ncbi:valyl-tRNA synthetase [Sinorhizobium fredii]
MLDKTYDSASVDPRIAKKWDDENAFRAGAGVEPGAETFCVVIPPPNVTGSLHMGHALNNTLQDVMVRFERMRGKDVLWQPGMDHAGIATQMVVERQLAQRKLPGRHEMGREAFIDKVWEWKAESGGLIFNQLKRLGASCDWSRERFTMDEGLSEAVVEVFVSLYKEGLIYRDTRLVNWDPKLQTAISDIEVEQVEVNGHLWHLRYPLEEGVTYQHPVGFDDDGNATEWETRDYLVVATTRPETMLGDTGVAVHPDDARYKAIVGQHVILPIVGRRIPIVADEYPDPTTGTGAVKMTPAHDFNDFEVGKRRGLRQVNVLTPDGRITIKNNEDFLEGLDHPAALHGAWDQLDGKDRFEARRLIVEILEAAGLVDHVEPHRHTVPHGDRGGVPIEPRLTEQWYVDARTLAKPAIASVREGRTAFVPRNWEKTYFEWMENIQPWCISRQLWWGHQIPAWYGPDGQVFVEKTEEEALHAAIQHYIAHEGPMKAYVEDLLENFKPGEILTRDEDVLDTWFSSALWPFSTLGWPKETPELEKYYQTDVLVTGFDIIFFWVARMMMMGLHFMKDADGTPVEPFHTVYVHALVRDKNGQKMSKSKGNVIDPLELIDEYGADALRFTLAIMAAQGRDVKLDPARIAGYRNFGTKLWNATRFAEMNGATSSDGFIPEAASLTVNRWILHHRTVAHDPRRHRSGRGISLQRCGRKSLPLHMEPVLRLVSRTAEAGLRRRGRGGQARIAGLRRLCAGRNLQALASVHAVHDRRALGKDRRTGAQPRHAPLPRRMAGCLLCGRPGGRRNQLADRPRVRDPLGPGGNERSAGGHGALGHRRCQGSDERAARSPWPRDQAAGEGGEHRARRSGAARQRADRHRRGDCLPSARQPHRFGRRKGPP